MTLTTTQLSFITNPDNRGAWSAAFVTYVMKTAGVSFPSNATHTGYAQEIRSDSGARYKFNVLNPTTDVPRVGDIIVQNRVNSMTFAKNPWSGTSHGDIVISATPSSVHAIGGNVSNTVKISTYSLVDGKLNPNFFVILRPLGVYVSKIQNIATDEEKTWANNKWTETSTPASERLQKYYASVNMSIPGYTADTPVEDAAATSFVSPDSYIENVYHTPFRITDFGGSIEKYKSAFTSNTTFNSAVVSIANSTIRDNKDIQGDLDLISNITQLEEKKSTQLKSVISNQLKSFSIAAKAMLVNSRLFEMFPDYMRTQMGNNSDVNPNYSHAWRAPGKLAITADITIPGMSGLRIGQIFWIDRLPRTYKTYGAFQLFGLTETIDIHKGWTTGLYARYNAIPQTFMTNLYDTEELVIGSIISATSNLGAF